LSTNDLYLEYNDRKVTIYDISSLVETSFMKLFPAYDVDESDVSPLYPKNPPTEKQDTIQLKGNGSGFFVSENIIATNYHVIEGASRVEIVINDGLNINKYLAKTLCYDKTNDLALVQIDDVRFSPLLQIPYQIPSESRSTGTDIYTMGYPMSQTMGEEVKITDGIISSKTGFEGNVATYQISAPIQPGNSGGPLFSKEGQVIGVTSSGILGADNVGYAIKSSYLRNLIESAPIEIKDISQNKFITSELSEQVKLFTPFVVMILIY
jgi:S1-C subfamily serine protease